MSIPDPDKLLERLRRGDVGALSQAITLVESIRSDHRKLAIELVGAALQSGVPSMRVAISGTPGSGKSTLINALGLRLIDAGHRVAVLAVDPSSPLSGGSILGDKTRMDKLSSSKNSFVRPSPSAGASGGVARSTRESIILCEAAGYDVILVETVGVGQAELAVNSMVDIFVLLTIAGAGDQLQGIKRGILELADIIAITKADGDNADRVEATRSSVRGTIGLLPKRDHGRMRKVLKTSAMSGDGLEDLHDALNALFSHLKESGHLDSRRKSQRAEWFRQTVRYLVEDRLSSIEDFHEIAEGISSGSIVDNPAKVAATFVDRVLK